jgi:hypothetical protein
MAQPHILGLTELVELFARVLANRLQHAVALAREADEALVNKRLQDVEVGVAYFLGASTVNPPAKTESVRKRRFSPG